MVLQTRVWAQNQITKEKLREWLETRNPNLQKRQMIRPPPPQTNSSTYNSLRIKTVNIHGHI